MTKLTHFKLRLWEGFGWKLFHDLSTSDVLIAHTTLLQLTPIETRTFQFSAFSFLEERPESATNAVFACHSSIGLRPSLPCAVDGAFSTCGHLCSHRPNDKFLSRRDVWRSRETLHFRWRSYCRWGFSNYLLMLYFEGRNSSIHEPWPDVLGVVIVFILSAMFILGLENSKVFSVLTITGVLSISGLLAAVTYVRGNTDSWTHQEYFPKGLPGVRQTTSN